MQKVYYVYKLYSLQNYVDGTTMRSGECSFMVK